MAVYSPEATAVFDEWKASEKLCHRGSKMCLALIGRKELVDRREVSENHDLLAPIVEHVGFLAKPKGNMCNIGLLKKVRYPKV